MGIKIFEFWSITPAEFDAYCYAYQKKKVSEHNAAITQSYFTAVFSNTEKLKPLENYLISEKEEEALTKEQLEEEKDRLAKLFGDNNG